jgi:hypothetical protein
MSRRILVTIVLTLSILGGNGLSARTVGASSARTLAPSAIDPTELAVPASLLPAGSTIFHSAVSDNPDADAATVPSDGHRALTTVLHLTQYGNEDASRANLGRLTGYRMDFTYTVSGAAVGTEYLASIFPSAAAAQAALNDATGSASLISLIGQPLPQTCSVGEDCKGFYAPNPLLSGQEAVVEVYVSGTILVETVTSAPSAGFDALEPNLQTTLNAFLLTTYSRVESALTGGQSTDTPTPVATSTPVPTATPAPAVTSAPKKKHCKKGYKIVKGKCKKAKKH